MLELRCSYIVYKVFLVGTSQIRSMYSGQFAIDRGGSFWILLRFSLFFFDFFAIFNVKIFTTAFLKSYISFACDWSLIDCFHKFLLLLLLLWILTFSCISFCLYLFFVVFTYCTRFASRFFFSLFLGLHCTLLSMIYIIDSIVKHNLEQSRDLLSTFCQPFSQFL